MWHTARGCVNFVIPFISVHTSVNTTHKLSRQEYANQVEYSAQHANSHERINQVENIKSLSLFLSLSESGKAVFPLATLLLLVGLVAGHGRQMTYTRRLAAEIL